jgi:FAS-associated factor 2
MMENQGNISDENMAQLIREQERMLQNIASQRSPPREVVENTRRSGDTLINEQDNAYEQSLRRDQEREQQARLERERIAREEEQERKRVQEEEERKQRRVELRAEKAKQLENVVEPDPNSEEGKGQVTKVLFRMPDGVTRVTRHFNHTDTLNMLFDFLDVNYELDVENFQLVTSYPTRRYSQEDNGNLTLKEAGIADAQTALFVSEKA